MLQDYKFSVETIAICGHGPREQNLAVISGWDKWHSLIPVKHSSINHSHVTVGLFTYSTCAMTDKT